MSCTPPLLLQHAVKEIAFRVTWFQRCTCFWFKWTCCWLSPFYQIENLLQIRCEFDRLLSGWYSTLQALRDTSGSFVLLSIFHFYIQGIYKVPLRNVARGVAQERSASHLSYIRWSRVSITNHIVCPSTNDCTEIVPMKSENKVVLGLIFFFLDSGRRNHTRCYVTSRTIRDRNILWPRRIGDNC